MPSKLIIQAGFIPLGFGCLPGVRNKAGKGIAQSMMKQMLRPIEPDDCPPEASAPHLTPLLQTKLFWPQSGPHLIRREELLERLDANPRARLVLVTAPAGFGKTTLVAQWLAARHDERTRRAAWLALDDGDNDLGRFWRYVIQALQTIEPALGPRVMALLSQPHLPPPDAWLGMLLNELAALDSPASLVLDDYQVIQSQAVHHSVNYFLQHLPPTLRLVFVARADPPLPLARLRVQDQLVELRAADLCFSEGEIRHYLNETMGLGLDHAALAALKQRTEGWPAGLMLAAHSLRDYSPDGREAFIRSFSGTHHLVLAYLLEEVLQQQDARTRDFLLQTSLLSRLSGPLCAAVTGQADSDMTLDRLARDRVFITPLDSAGHWYRYHPLFAESLEARLRQENPSLWHEVHRQAGAWCAHNGHAERAIDHALACGDYVAAAGLIEAIGEKTWTSGDINALLRWLDRLPREVVKARLSLELLTIWVLFLHDRWEEATTLWREADGIIAELDEPERSLRRGVWLAVGGAMGGHRQDVEATIAMALESLSLLSPDEVTWRSVSIINLGLAYSAQGNHALAESHLHEAAALNIARGNIYLAFAAVGHLTDVYLILGRLHESQAACERLRQLEEMPGGAALLLRANGDVGLGRLAYERNQLLDAERLLLTGLAQIWPGGQPRVVLWGRLTLARVYVAQGDYERARVQLQMADELVRALGMPAEGGMVQAAIAELALREGRPGAVAEWRAGARVSPDDAPDFRREPEHCVLATVLMCNGDHASAERFLARLRADADCKGRNGSLIYLLLLHAVALNGLERGNEAVAAVRRAVTLAQPQGYVRVFLDVGPPLMALIRHPAVRAQAPAYTAQISHLLDLEFSRPTIAPPALAVSSDEHAELVEGLTPRELEILRLIARGASNQDIAEALFLSVGTVKGHVNHILSKLDVHNRTAAVARSRELELI